MTTHRRHAGPGFIRVVLLLMVLIPIQALASDSWERFPTANTAPSVPIPNPSFSHTAVWTGMEMITWGGLNDIQALSTGMRYAPSNQQLKQVPTIGAPSPRSGHSAVWTGTEMIVWGGQDAEGNRLATGGRYNPATDTWSATASLGAPSARTIHTAVWTGTTMIVWGGAEAGESAVNTGAVYDPATDTWSPLNSAGAPAARFGHSAVWTGLEMVVWGGSPGSGPSCGAYCVLNDGAHYAPASDAWTPTPTTGAPAARFDHTVVWTGEEMIVWGGRSSATIAEGSGGRYIPRLGLWIPLAHTGAPTPRVEQTAVWTGSEMIIWGGGDPIIIIGADERPNGLATGARYSPLTNTWTAVSPLAAPGPRRAHSAVWTGQEMIVVGGWNTWRFKRPAEDDMAAYFPHTNAWGGASTVPGSLASTQAVWTGDQMIVFGGGALYTDPMTAGWRYSLASHRWSPAGGAEAPAGRVDHSLLWTGNTLIVWGGLRFERQPRDRWLWLPLDDGGRYNPAHNQWSPLSTTSAPSPRSEHSTVWTGTEMIVWGGWYHDTIRSEVFNTGGRYNPTTDTWAPVTTTGAPSARRGHTAVWTGTEMIVWGGSDGGRYNPATDTWSPVSLVGAPDTRFAHSAIWTGTEMIVWGGVNGSSVLNSGARYAPATNTWSPLPSVQAPSPRFDHSAVWTGREMIVWGGTGSTDSANPLPQTSGARYSPATDTWSPMASTNAPPPGTAATWSGEVMIVPGLTGADRVHAYSPPSDVDFQITRISRDQDSLSLDFPSRPGLTYTLWVSDRLAGGSWSVTGQPALAGNGSTLSFHLPAATLNSPSFFRVMATTTSP
jgi:N-acetylneuraminic acid mutarotase